MNTKNIRATATGVTAGVTAGIVLVAGAIVYDSYDPWGKLQHALARARLTPEERSELDRITAEKKAQDEAAGDAEEYRLAVTRSQFRPELLSADVRADTVEGLSVPELVSEIDRVLGMFRAHRITPAEAWWWEQRAALLAEFDHRTNWRVKQRLPQLDQLRLEIATHRISQQRYQRPTPPPTAASPAEPTGLDHPDFTSPGAEALADADRYPLVEE